MSSSHNFSRNEKLSRILEYDWGGWADPLTRDEALEPFMRGAHLKAVIATLEQGLVIRRLGALAAEDQDALRLAIGQIIG